MNTLIRPGLVAVGAADYVDVFFADGFVEEAGGQGLVGGDGFVADRAHAGYAWFAFGVAVRAALNCHELVRDLHRTVNLGNKLFADKKLGLAYRTFYRLQV